MKRIINKITGEIKLIGELDPIPGDYTDIFPTPQLIKPIWNNDTNSWVEGADDAYIEMMNRQQMIDQINALNEKFEADGKAYQKEVKNRVTAQLVGRPDAIPIMREINKTVYVLLDKIAKGDWPLAMLDYLDGENNPTIPEVVELFDEVGQKAIEYYQNEYPH